MLFLVSCIQIILFECIYYKESRDVIQSKSLFYFGINWTFIWLNTLKLFCYFHTSMSLSPRLQRPMQCIPGANLFYYSVKSNDFSAECIWIGSDLFFSFHWKTILLYPTFFKDSFGKYVTGCNCVQAFSPVYCSLQHCRPLLFIYLLLSKKPNFCCSIPEKLKLLQIMPNCKMLSSVSNKTFPEGDVSWQHKQGYVVQLAQAGDGEAL